MEDMRRWLNWFFYLAPLWFLLETMFWPGFRAGVVTGGSGWGNLLFYSVEAGLGAAIWYRLPYANAGALVENVIYLIFVIKFILLSPLDAAMAMEGDMPRAMEIISNYRASLPGVIYSMAYVAAKIRQGVDVQERQLK